MSIEVICAGFGRTGTLSLKVALQKLGYARCYHMIELLKKPGHANTWTGIARGDQPNWPGLFDGYRSVVDWPAAYFWRELVEFYPRAKVILSVRDAEKWWQSISNTVFAAIGGAFPEGATEPQLPPDQPQERREQLICARAIISEGTFQGRIDEREHCISVYEQHNAEVIRSVPQDRLFVYEIKQGWDPLCDFLHKPVPKEAFPRTNTRDEFILRES